MGKLDVSLLRYLNPEDIRVLTAVEMGMKNHEIVPVNLISVIAKLRSGGCHKILKNLSEGYYLTYKGYDYLALKVFIKQGQISHFGSQIGVGKESDVYVVCNDNGQQMALKIHRLGRNSFRKLREKRDYLKQRNGFSWLYLSRLAATKEFAFLKALHKRDFPVPTPVSHNRHCVLMELMRDHVPLNQLCPLQTKESYQIINTNNNLLQWQSLFERLMNLLMKLAACGLIHCDFNEFNLLFNPSDLSDIVMIDFPQIVSLDHPNAKEYFERDVGGVLNFFRRKLGLTFETFPTFQDVITMSSTQTESHQHNIKIAAEKSIEQDMKEESTSLMDRFLTDSLLAKATNTLSDNDFDSEKDPYELIRLEPILEIAFGPEDSYGILGDDGGNDNNNRYMRVFKKRERILVDLPSWKSEEYNINYDKGGSDSVDTDIATKCLESLRLGRQKNHDNETQSIISNENSEISSKNLADTTVSTILEDRVVKERIKRECRKNWKNSKASKSEGNSKIVDQGRRDHLLIIKEERNMNMCV
ncbi:unnamed protein product [Gordionus sp. m RMFG-2023]